ncbi:RNA polymerase I enhancer binding protein [Emmonsiellopsis sp. PD_33]|nr:RNA polymerase I enhancer binding protein [Emmonsiellopsis sp. PD_33]KAK2800609.1 RNA polymerase I enhancer binding protein [Onygenales sp. PD_10]
MEGNYPEFPYYASQPDEESEPMSFVQQQLLESGAFESTWALQAPESAPEEGFSHTGSLQTPVDPRLQGYSYGEPQQDPAFLEPLRLFGDQGFQQEIGESRDRLVSEEDSLFCSMEPSMDAAVEGPSAPEPQQPEGSQTATPVATTPTAQQSKKATKPRKPKAVAGVSGRYSAAEVAAVEEFKTKFCEEHRCSGDDFGKMVQAPQSGPFPCPVTGPEFWAGIYAVVPGRRPRDVQRYMRSRYAATSQKPRIWTREQDDELAVLHATHGSDFAKIARILGRTRDDVNTRFRKHVQYRDTKKTGPWSGEECVDLEAAVLKWRDEQIAEPSTASLSRDIYQVDPNDILWTRVSEILGFTRTREQCSSKWKVLREKRAKDAGP